MNPWHDRDDNRYSLDRNPSGHLENTGDYRKEISMTEGDRERRMTLLDPADRCEKATGPDRELDAAIWLHLPEQEGHAWKHDGDRFAHAHQVAGVSFVPRYTASLDAAMTLVVEPEKGVSVWRSPRDGGLCCATVHHGEVAEASTMAPALCAAALKARAAIADTHAKRGDSTEIEAPSVMSGGGAEGNRT